MSFKSLKIKEGDIVLTQSYTFGATINSIVHAGGNPFLFDIYEKTLSINLEQVENYLIKDTYKKGNFYFDKKTKKRVYCICPVLSFSIVPDLKKLKHISKKYNLKIILDAASALGSKFYKKSLENFSDIVVYSFNGNKSYTSGGGGIISTNNKSYHT